MLKNYFTIALRFMTRQKGFSLINIAGLTIGLASSLLILLYINDELSFDTFHTDAERIYRVSLTGTLHGKTIHSAYTAAPLAQALRESGAESTLRIASWATFPIRYEDRSFTEPHLLLVDSNFFRFFSFKLIEGDPDLVLKGERKVVLTESAAQRYFDYKGRGDISPIGKQMSLAQGYIAYVSGIAEDPPLNSHLHFTCLLSLSSWTEALESGWLTSRVVTYFKTKPEVPEGTNHGSLQKIKQRYLAPALDALKDEDAAASAPRNDLNFTFQPLLRIHLHSNLADEIEPNSDIRYIYLFGSIAGFITILACINFMNLSTARSASRAREVGVRKSVGAPNSWLIGQFLLESYFYCFIAVLLALFIIMVLIGPFNALTQKQLDSSSFFTSRFVLGIAAFVVIVGLVAGSYPAFYLVQFSPIQVLKGRIREGFRSYGIRNVLVVFQFFISVALVIATLTVYLQLRYIQRVSLGFDKKNVINLIHTANLEDNGVVFKQKLLELPGVISASYCNRLPPNVNWTYSFRPSNSDKEYLLNVYEMDYDHMKTMKYAITKGRFFSTDFPGDTGVVILNETAAAQMKLEKLDKQMVFTTYGNHKTPREVIGIIKDFNFQSLKDSIQPMAATLSRQPNWEMAIRIDGAEPGKTMDAIKQLWEKYTTAPFEYTFLEKNFDARMNTEKRIGLLFLLFTVLAVFIASLGLYGLATFTAEQRTKEIGIRKVLGATTNTIVLMLNADFLKLVFIANLVAWPITWWLMQKWLNQFAYHISIPWWTFIIAAIFSALIAFLSVSSRALRAAQGDPVNSLRNE